jgi:tetratricopeptide (TPR) repeat protein
MNQSPHHLEATAISHRAEKVFDTSGKPDAALLDDSSPAITYNVDAEVADLFKTSEINISGFTHPSDCQLMNERRDMLIEKYGYMGASHRLKLAYDDCFAVMGADHFDTLQMSLSLAFVLRKQKKYQDAERLYRQANIRYRKRLGDRHAKLLQCAGLLGHVLCELGRYSEAVVYFRQVRDWFRQNSENDETRAACANCWVGRALLAQEEYEEAGAILQQAYEYFATAFGEDQRNAYSVAECLAASLCKQGRHYAANMLFQKAYNGYRRTDGETAESTLYAAHMLAQTAHARAIFRQAEQVSWEANQGCEDVIGERCSQNPQAINIHARALNKEVRHDEALELSENHQYLGRCFPSF